MTIKQFIVLTIYHKNRNELILFAYSCPNKTSPARVTLKIRDWRSSDVSQSRLYKVTRAKPYLFGIEYRRGFYLTRVQLKSTRRVRSQRKK